MMSDQAVETVFVVDDDGPFRDSLKVLFESVGLEVREFAEAQSFLDEVSLNESGCIVLDIRMPGMSGLELQQVLNDRGNEIPIVFMTGHGDIEMAVSAMKDGAIDFLTKPFSHQDLLDRVHRALREGAEVRDQYHEKEALEERLDSLTPREREVLELVVTGAANKVMANRLDVSQRTVEIHRAAVMKKMDADSLADLVRMAVALGL